MIRWWLWAVLWPSSAGCLLYEELSLADLREAGHEMSLLPFGALTPRILDLFQPTPAVLDPKYQVAAAVGMVAVSLYLLRPALLPAVLANWSPTTVAAFTAGKPLGVA